MWKDVTYSLVGFGMVLKSCVIADLPVPRMWH
jgi:hypothetical protein